MLVGFIVLIGFILDDYLLPLPFMIRQSFMFFIYFVGGFLLGKKLIHFISNKRRASILL